MDEQHLPPNDVFQHDLTTLQSAYDALASRVVVLPVPARDMVRVTGKDRSNFLHNFCTNDIQRLQIGDSCETFLCNSQGKIVGHGYVHCQADALYFDTAAGFAEATVAHLDRYIIREDVQLEDVSGQWQHFLVAGPNSEPWLKAYCEEQSLNGLVIESDWVSTPSRLLIVDRAHDARSRFSRDTSVVLASSELFDVLRVEQGTPIMGRDIFSDNLPQEVDRDAKAISFVKGCYLGQETVARIDALGHVNRALRGLRFSDDSTVAPNLELRAGDKVVGRVTSVVHSPRLKTIGLGYVRREHFAPGTQLESNAGPVLVVSLPHATREKP